MCGTQLDSVLGRRGAVLIEAVVDQFTPPMPPKIKTSQALKLAEALMRGEPNRGKIVVTNAHNKVRELVERDKRQLEAPSDFYRSLVAGNQLVLL